MKYKILYHFSNKKLDLFKEKTFRYVWLSIMAAQIGITILKSSVKTQFIMKVKMDLF
ncbi:hypothetical protein C414_000260006 [Campylobacter jejuni subsp. jejuni 414]|nr:hypothetical protein C414_000260006 [Campylobacter jejuni subsp. jejuni 414]HDZ4937944.1 hypothetical protein [Campylobacter jejuni]HDZ5074943.1 hypothetical protein [Campylobacter jejuni]